MMRISRLLLVGALLAAPFSAGAVDAERAREIFGPCAGCHGEFGAGGKKGDPRIAGQQKKYIEQQLMAFQKRIRPNIPMVPYTEERELATEDMKVVAEWLSQVELDTKMPVFKGDEDALTRLKAVEKVMIVPRVKGDIDNGGRIFQKQCASCHGKQGRGKGMFPMIAGQYTNYLQKQIDAFLKAARPHDEDTANVGVLYTLKPEDIQDVMAYLTTLQNLE